MKDFWEAAGSTNLGWGLKGNSKAGACHVGTRSTRQDIRHETSTCVYVHVYLSVFVCTDICIYKCTCSIALLMSCSSLRGLQLVVRPGFSQAFPQNSGNPAAPPCAVAAVLEHYQKIPKPALNKRDPTRLNMSRTHFCGDPALFLGSQA